MISKYTSLTARLYQAGLEIDVAIAKGASRELFMELDAEFKGGSIPAHLINGFPYQAPYSCDYHTGGAQGAKLRAICAASKVES